MFDVSGKLSELIKNGIGTEINMTQEFYDSMLNMPITDTKGNAIGSIINIDLDQDRWYGVFYKKESVQLRLEDKRYKFMGIVID